MWTTVFHAGSPVAMPWNSEWLAKQTMRSGACTRQAPAATSIVLAEASQLARQPYQAVVCASIAIDIIFQGRGQQGESSAHHRPYIYPGCLQLLKSTYSSELKGICMQPPCQAHLRHPGCVTQATKARRRWAHLHPGPRVRFLQQDRLDVPLVRRTSPFKILQERVHCASACMGGCWVTVHAWDALNGGEGEETSVVGGIGWL